MPNEAAKHPLVEFKEFMAFRSPELAAMLPSSVSVEKFKQICVTAAMQNPALLFADRLSLWNSCRKCATDGLLPDGKEAVLLIYRTKSKDGKYTDAVQYQPMVQGIYKRTRNSGEITALYGHEVYKNDKFRIRLGFDREIEHEPALGERGPIIGAYACVVFKDGGRDMEWMPREDIEKARAKSKAADSLMWREFYGEGCIKTVIKRFGKRLPVSSDIVALLNRDDDAGDESLPAIPALPATMALAHEPPLDMPIVEERIPEPAQPQAPQAEAEPPSRTPIAKATASVPPEPKPAPTQAHSPAADLTDAQIVVAEFSRQIDEATDKAGLKILWENVERADLFQQEKDMLKMKAQSKQAALNIARAGR